ncbi:MAG: ABC transporter permease [Bacteroidota bacterium]
MYHLLKLEWLKLKNHRISQILIFIYLIALPSLLLIGKSFDEIPEDLFSKDMFFMFPAVWQYLGYVGNWLTFFVFGFIAVLTSTNEYHNKTLRQNVITGLSRREYFLSKTLFIVMMSLLATAYFVIWALLFGATHTETIYMSKVTQYAGLIPRYFLMVCSYMTIGFFISTIVRRTGISLFLYLAWAFFIERILRYAMHYQLLEGKSIHFYPINATSDLVPFNTPLNKMAEGFMKENNFSIFLSPTEAVITTTVYLLLFLWLTHQMLQKRDL